MDIKELKEVSGEIKKVIRDSKRSISTSSYNK